MLLEWFSLRSENITWTNLAHAHLSKRQKQLLLLKMRRSYNNRRLIFGFVRLARYV